MIDAKSLYKTFGKIIAVDNVSIQVDEGEIYGLIGPDGAGKTTTLRLLCGALKPSAHTATIQIGGVNLLRNTDQARAEIGYLPQRFSLYEEMTVLENLRFFAEVRGLSSTEWRPRSMEILEFVDLADFTNRRAGDLSGGMKQKLGLAAALVHNPKVLLLDEPTTGVDPVTRQDFWQLIIRLLARNHDVDHPPTVLICTPYMDEAARCNRVAFMREGKLLLEGTPEELRSGFESHVLEILGQPLTMMRRILSTYEDIQDVQMFGDRLHLSVNPGNSEAIINSLMVELPSQGVQITRLRKIPPQLEDVFMSLSEAEC